MIRQSPAQNRSPAQSVRDRIPAFVYRFVMGGIAYCGIEIAYRGRTHLSMLLLGGLCFVILCAIANSGLSLLSGAAAGGLSITAAELIAGAAVNLWWGMGVWDYSLQPLNLWGQVCLKFTLLWCVLSGIVIYVYRAVRAKLAETHKMGVKTDLSRIGREGE